MAQAGPSMISCSRLSSARPPDPSRLCLSCFSSIPPKTAARAHITPCCGQPICYACLAANPRLREYVPCLSCGDGVQASKARRRMRGGAGGGAVESGDWDSRGQFALGANSDEEGDGEPQRSRGDSPPRYEEIGSDGQESAASMGPPSDSQPDAGVHSPSATNNDEVASVDEDEDDEDEPLVEPIQHMVMRGDTVRGLATRYGLDPYELLKINSLPFEALQSNPQLVQTRKFLLLTRPAASDRAGGMQVAGRQGAAMEEDEARQQQRKLKRFQLVTKEADTSVARAYLALEDLAQASATPHDVLFSLDDEEKAGAGAGAGRSSEKKGAGSGGADPEARAVNRFFDDNQWEQAQQTAGPSAAGARSSRAEKRPADATVKTGSLLQGAPWLIT